MTTENTSFPNGEEQEVTSSFSENETVNGRTPDEESEEELTDEDENDEETDETTDEETESEND